MASQTLADLLVSMSLDSAKMSAGLKKSQKEISDFASVAAQAAKRIEHLMEFEVVLRGAEQLYEFVKSSAEAADALGKMAQRAGLSVEDMGRLSYAAKMADLSQESLAGAISRLSKSMEEAQSGTGKTAVAYHALRVSVTDSMGALRPTVDVLKDVADRFAGMRDGANKTAIAMMLFGKSGAELVPFLNQGKAGIQAMMTEADSLGKVMSGEVQRGAAAFADELKKMQGTSALLGATIAAQLAPSLSRLNVELVATKDSLTGIPEVAAAVAGGIKGVAAAAIIGAQALRPVVDGLRAMRALKDLNFGDFKKYAAQSVFASNPLTQLRLGIAEARKLLAEPLPAPGGAGAAYDPLSSIRKPLDPGPNVAALLKETEAVKDLEKEIRTLQERAAGTGMGQSAALMWSAQFGNLAEKLKDAGSQAGALRSKLFTAIRAVGAAEAQAQVRKLADEGYGRLTSEIEKSTLQAMKGEDVTHATRLEWELTNGELKKSIVNVRAAAKSWDEFSAIQDIIENLRNSANLEDVAEGTKGLREALKGLQRQTADAGFTTERERVAYELAEGTLKKYVDEMGGPGTAQARQFTAALLHQADVVDALRTKNELLSSPAGFFTPEATAKRAQEMQGQLDRIRAPEMGFSPGTQQMLTRGVQLQARADLQAKAPELFEGTQEQVDLQLEQLQAMYDQIGQMRKANLISEQTAQQMRVKVGAKQDEARLAGAKDFFGTLAQLQNSSNRELAAIGKAAAIAQATIDGVLAVQKALASAPPPWNFAIATAVGAVTAANVAQIAATGFSRGGFTGYGPTDETAGLVHRREFVVNAAATSRYRPMLEAINKGQSLPVGEDSLSPVGFFSLSIENRGTAQNYEAVPQLTPNEIRLIAKDEASKAIRADAPHVIASQFNAPNSRVSESVARSLMVARRR